MGASFDIEQLFSTLWTTLISRAKLIFAPQLLMLNFHKKTFLELETQTCECEKASII